MVVLPYDKSYQSRLLEIFKLNTPKYFAQEEQGDFESFLHSQGKTYYVIKSMSTIVGGGGYQVNDHTGQLVWNILDPEFRGQGFGGTLLNYCIDQLRMRTHVSEAELWTSQYAHEFYAKFGFRVVDKKPDFWGTGLDLYRMSRSI